TMQEKTERKRLFIETYGCQMNVADSEVVAGIMAGEGYELTDELKAADLILVNTCSVREKAEQTVRNKLANFTHLKRLRPHLVIGVLGCMAERLKEKLLEEERMVDLVAGPDAYRDLPRLVGRAQASLSAVNVRLSLCETYDGIRPVRLSEGSPTAFVSVMRGCDNMCTYCVVPYTRGRERSRDPQSVLEEIGVLQDKGVREVTLLGQNIDSYLWYGGGAKKDFEKASREARENACRFSGLLSRVAEAFPRMRIRFCTSNPHDMTDDVLDAIASHPNICRYLHLPFQSGSTRILRHMHRGYTREEYLALIDRIRAKLPDCGLTMDVIAGYPTETEEDHRQTLSLMEYVKYDFGYMFKYSERPGTYAARHYPDDVPEEVKQRRLDEIIALQAQHSAWRNAQYIGRECEVLCEGTSKKDAGRLFGRNSQGIVVVFDAAGHRVGDFVRVRIDDTTQGTLLGSVVEPGAGK
ncbi:MAG TPA: tRNA (N6-isopentenyl adenosine(37)-C2)-methylthiotransferase MiaB, partial [Candidatus Merdimorpha stercoravium]|nr:tRNA (N6-isopentenyl adenosine(37)-C2)-methylthiotransferase MiaB [Candidatus Merdimorpha stercoravium]